MLEEGVGNHRHKCMTMKALPGSALEVIKTEFFFHLLVSLLANPTRLDGGCQGAQVGLRRQVGEIIFLLSGYPVFADKPSLVAGQMLMALVSDPLWRSVGDPHADSSETSLELSFRAGSPTDGAPFGIGQHVFGRDRQSVWDMPLTRTAAPGNRPDHPHIGRIDLEVARNTDGPAKFASREPLTEWRAHPIARIRQHAAKAHTGRDDTVDLCQGHLRLRPCLSVFGRNTRSLQSSAIARPTLGKKQPQRQNDRNFASRQRQRYQGLAVRGLAQRRSILRSDTYRMRALLGYRGVVDHQYGIAGADELIRLNQQFGLHRPGIPHSGRDEVVQLIVITKCNPLRPRLNALAVAKTDQSRHVERAHLSPGFVTQPIQKRLEPTPKLASPIRRRANHGRPLQKADHP